MAFLDQKTGYYGITIDSAEGIVDGKPSSDEHGQVKRCLFSIMYPLQPNDVDFTISNGPDDWAALMGDGSLIPLSNPVVLYANRDCAIVQFDLTVAYPSNSPCFLVYHSQEASFNIRDHDSTRPYIPNAMSGHIGYTVHGHGATMDEHGQVDRMIITIPFPQQPTDVTFTISNDPSHWGAHMGCGHIIGLHDPVVLASNRDNAVVLFEMDEKYPANSPCILVYRSAEANVNILADADPSDFVPVRGIMMAPAKIVTGVPCNLSSCEIDPYYATNKGIRWTVLSGDATVDGDEITANKGGTITLKAEVAGGLDNGERPYETEITIEAVQNVITIDADLPGEMSLLVNEISDQLSVDAECTLGPLTYQWFSAPMDNTGFVGTMSPILDATKPVYEIPTSTPVGGIAYMCSISSPGATTVTSGVCKVTVSKRLLGISINNKITTMEAGKEVKMTCSMNPVDAPVPQLVWTSSNPMVIQTRDDGTLVGIHGGSAMITVTTADGLFSDAMPVTIPVHVPVEKIVDVITTMDTNTSVPLTGTVTPSDATNRNIRWSILDAGTTGATLTDGKVITTEPGILVVRATIEKGTTGMEDYNQDVQIEVVRKFIPVTDVQLNNSVALQAGIYVDLNPTVVPGDASRRLPVITVTNDGGTGAVIRNNILYSKTSGNVGLRVTVVGGGVNKANFVKDFTVSLSDEFVPVEFVAGLPARFEDLDVPLPLAGVVKPDNASIRSIQYTLKNPSSAKATLDNENKLHIDPSTVTWYTENPNPTPPDYWDQWILAITDVIVVEVRVLNGLGPGRDFVSDVNITVVPPAAPDIFIPVDHLEQEYPSINRAKRPILLNRLKKIPWNATASNLITLASRASDGSGGICQAFIPNQGSAWHWYDAYGIEMDPMYDWTMECSYLYPTEDAAIEFEFQAPMGTADGGLYTQKEVINFLPEYIPVKNIKNIPMTLPANASIILAPEFETNYQVKSRTTAIYDIDVPSYTDVVWRVSNAGTAGATIVNGVLQFKRKGTAEIEASVAQGTQEEFTWYDKDFEAIAYKQKFSITVGDDEEAYGAPIVTLTLANKSTVEITKMSDLYNLSNYLPGSTRINVAGKTFAKQDVVKIEFWNPDDFDKDHPAPVVTSLKNFARNFTRLTEIDRIPSTVAGADCLNGFLAGCTSFNQELSIPAGVTGARCLREFLAGCTSFNHPVDVPAGVKGNGCLERFLSGCTSFNSVVTLPSGVTGDRCMLRFLERCTSFNQAVNIPSTVSGQQSLDHFLYGCTKFNKPVTLPEDLDGLCCMRGFMRDTYAMISDITISKKVADAVTAPDPTSDYIGINGLTLACYGRGTVTVEHGVPIKGTGADTFKSKMRNSLENLPLRKLI